MNLLSSDFRKRYPSFLLPSLIFFLFFLAASDPLDAYWVWSPESGKFVNPEGAVQDAADQQYHYALGFYEAQNYDKAIRELKNLTKKYPASHIAPEAHFKLGEIYEEKNEFYKAFQTYQKVVENYPNSSRINEVIEKQYRIGNVFLSGKKPKLMGVPLLPALPRAIEVFEQVVENAPFGAYGDKSMFQLGIAFRRSGNSTKALETFQRFIENYPESPLIPDAKLQLGEVSFEMSKNMSRSQEGLESAEDYFDSFVPDNPSADIQEKAARLKKAIDEKNAEKNFKIGEYYESESYLESAVIYFEDVLKNYPDTSWAAKAKEKLSVFRSPVKYIKQKEDVLQTELARVSLRKRELEQSLVSLKGQGAQRKQVQQNLLKVRKKEKELRGNLRSFGRKKVSDIRNRAEALKRKEFELKEKQSALERKKKTMQDHPSEDLKRAFKNWSDSLRQEATALEREKNELAKIEQVLGITTGFRLPLPHKQNVQGLRQMHIDALAELMKEKKQWDIKKEELYEFRSSVLTQLDELRGEDIEILAKKKDFQELLRKEKGGLLKKTTDLNEKKKRLDLLKSKLGKKREQLEELAGSSSWFKILKSPKKVVQRSWDLITFSSHDPEEKLKEAEKKSLRLKEEIAEKKSIIQSMERAFQEDLQGKVGKGTPPEIIRGTPETNVEHLPEEIKLKKRMKLIEREIRWRYEEIQDRNLSKRNKLDALDALLKSMNRQGGSGMSKVGKAAVLPASGLYRFSRAFLFGLREREQVIRQESLRVQSVSRASDPKRIQKLREEIEFESILIEARAREIEILKSDLKVLKAKAAKLQGFSYRSVFFERPGTFLEDVVKGAKKIFPKREQRREILIEKLDQTIQELSDLRRAKRVLSAKIKEIKEEISLKKAQPIPVPEGFGEPQKSKARSEEIVSLQDEFVDLQREVRGKEASYQKDREAVQKELREFYRHNFSRRLEERFGMDDKSFMEKSRIYDEERKKTEEEILKIVKKEEKIVRKQQELLTKKKEKITEKITDFKRKEDYRSEILENELEDLLTQVRLVQTEQQNLLEEKKKISESLKAEVGSFEK